MINIIVFYHFNLENLFMTLLYKIDVNSCLKFISPTTETFVPGYRKYTHIQHSLYTVYQSHRNPGYTEHTLEKWRYILCNKSLVL